MFDINAILSLVQFIAALAILIIIHELGHFIAARLMNIEIEEFGLGFPPRIMTLFEAGGTIFSLNWIPLGGFVRPRGENDPDVPGGLASANPWARLFVLFAGPIMNLLAGAALFATLAWISGRPIPDQVEIVQIAPGSPSELAGLQEGDIFVTVNDTPITSMVGLSDAIEENLEKETQLTLTRDTQIIAVTLVPRSQPPANEGAIGICMGAPTTSAPVSQVIPVGFAAVWFQITNLVSLPGRLIEGSLAPEEGRLVGYKGMYDIYSGLREGSACSTGSLNLMAFFGSISVSLGLLNLLPIPALDGGRILFTLPEIIFRRRIPQSYENVINLVGFAALIALLIYVNLQDFVNPIILP